MVNVLPFESAWYVYLRCQFSFIIWIDRSNLKLNANSFKSGIHRFHTHPDHFPQTKWGRQIVFFPFCLGSLCLVCHFSKKKLFKTPLWNKNNLLVKHMYMYHWLFIFCSCTWFGFPSWGSFQEHFLNGVPFQL